MMVKHEHQPEYSYGNRALIVYTENKGACIGYYSSDYDAYYYLNTAVEIKNVVGATAILDENAIYHTLGRHYINGITVHPYENHQLIAFNKD